MGDPHVTLDFENSIEYQLLHGEDSALPAHPGATPKKPYLRFCGIYVPPTFIGYFGCVYSIYCLVASWIICYGYVERLQLKQNSLLREFLHIYDDPFVFILDGIVGLHVNFRLLTGIQKDEKQMQFFIGVTFIEMIVKICIFFITLFFMRDNFQRLLHFVLHAPYLRFQFFSLRVVSVYAEGMDPLCKGRKNSSSPSIDLKSQQQQQQQQQHQQEQLPLHTSGSQQQQQPPSYHPILQNEF